MPRPAKGESEQEYVSRFMDSTEAKRDYPDTKQRAAVAYSMWREKGNVGPKIKIGARCIVGDKTGEVWDIGGKDFQQRWFVVKFDDGTQENCEEGRIHILPKGYEAKNDKPIFETAADRENAGKARYSSCR